MRWLVTGSAGFIGSNLCKTILLRGDAVIGVDNFSSGKRENVDRILTGGGSGLYSFVEGDITELGVVEKLIDDVDVVVHLAAQGSVQKSFADVANNNKQNVDGFINTFSVASKKNVQRFIYASSCAVYGDARSLPIKETQCPQPLSPYASSKLMNDHLANNLRHFYPNFGVTGLRFFNVFGPWQDPYGDYAAVIPRWIDRCILGQPPIVFGDGSATRDFCYVGNVCDLIIRIGEGSAGEARGIYNVSSGRGTALNELYIAIVTALQKNGIRLPFDGPEYHPWREGDIVHSCGDVSLARSKLGFDSKISLLQGIEAILNEQYTL